MLKWRETSSVLYQVSSINLCRQNEACRYIYTKKIIHLHNCKYTNPILLFYLSFLNIPRLFMQQIRAVCNQWETWRHRWTLNAMIGGGGQSESTYNSCITQKCVTLWVIKWRIYDHVLQLKCVYVIQVLH